MILKGFYIYIDIHIYIYIERERYIEHERTTRETTMGDADRYRTTSL